MGKLKANYKKGHKPTAICELLSTIAWKIPWMEKPGRLQSMGSQSRTRLSDFTSLQSEAGLPGMISVHRTKGAGRPPKLHLPRNLQIRAHAPLHLRNQLTTTSRSRRASKGTCFLFSLPPSGYSRSPDKALPKFLLWHLTNFCRLKSPRARVNPPSRSISAFLHPCVEPNFLCRSDTSSHRKSKQRRRP